MKRADQRQPHLKIEQSKSAVESAEQVSLEIQPLEPIITPMIEALRRSNQPQHVEIPVQVGAVDASLEIFCAKPNSLMIDVVFKTAHDEVYISIRCSPVELSTKTMYAETAIRRNRANIAELPPNSGIFLYRSVLDFFQGYANTHQQSISHTVRCSMEMPLDKWKAIFLPTLEEYGYTKPFIEDLLLSYRKVYKPRGESL